MGERHRCPGGGLGFHRLALRQHRHLLPPRSPPSQKRRPMRSAGGEIMEVEGGRIVRSIGRKDRHSKVYTAKGPRDRRVRLAAHTAIQFYDVQDRLGYDRPSKAVDWLIQNAKAAIDQLAELPRRTPAPASSNSTSCAPQSSSSAPAAADPPTLEPAELPIPSAAFIFGDGGGDGGASFLPPSLDSDTIAETIKSFFPMAAAAVSPAASPPDFKDFRLSLQSFQDPIGHNYLGFDAIAGGWATEQSQRMSPWSVAETSGGGGFEGFAFDVPPPEAAPLHAVLGPSLLFSQREPLQSSNPLAAGGWAAEPVAPSAELQEYPALLRPSASAMEFVSESCCSGFRIPAGIQGEEDGGNVSDEPPSSSRHWP